MVITTKKSAEYLVVDTTAFIQNAPLQEVAEQIVTCQEVVDEIKNKRQLRRLVVLPYDLEIKQVFPENIKIVTDFAKKTGDYPTLSATDIKVMALTYQLEKELVGTKHLRTEPVIQRSVNVVTKKPMTEASADVTGFYLPKKNQGDDDGECTVSDEEEEFGSDLEYSDGELEETVDDIKKSTKEGGNNVKETSDDIQVEDNLVKTAQGECKQNENSLDDILVPISRKLDELEIEDSEDDEDDNDEGWITPSNIQNAKSRFNSDLVEGKSVKVACITTDFAMQNVLKQLNLNVSALDGRMIRQLRTFILRCYTCFSTTSVMTKKFCPKCGNSTLKRVGVSLDADGKQQIHINGRRPLTARGKKFSLPTMKGGKHSNNPHLVEDQPFPDQRPTRLARMKNNPMEDDYISGYSPFVMRDITSKSSQLNIRPDTGDFKHWMRKNPNEARRRRK